MKGNKRKTGFTIVELVIVLAVIALLAAALLPTLTRVINGAKEKAALSEARNEYLRYVSLAATKGEVPSDVYFAVNGFIFEVSQGQLQTAPVTGVFLIAGDFSKAVRSALSVAGQKPEEAGMADCFSTPDCSGEALVFSDEPSSQEDRIVYFVFAEETDGGNHKVIVLEKILQDSSEQNKPTMPDEGNPSESDTPTMPDSPAVHVHEPSAPREENATDSTCIQTGSYEEVIVCLTCGEELSRTLKTLPLSGHAYDGEYCAVCRERDGSFFTEGLQFSLCAESGEYFLTGYEGEEERVVIPATYLGKPVTAIASDALRGKKVSEVILGSNIGRIEEGAFSNLFDLTEMRIGAGVTQIEEGAFQGTKIGYFFVDENNSFYRATEGSLYTKDGSVLIGCARQGGICGSVTRIGKGVFASSEIAEIALPNGLKEIGKEAFCGCISLREIAIPNGVSKIEEGAFKMCISLKNVSFSQTLCTVGKEAFFGCEGLTSFIFPLSVVEVGENAFGECSLRAVYYEGSESDYAAKGFSSPFMKATLYWSAEASRGMTFEDNTTWTYDEAGEPALHVHYFIKTDEKESTCTEKGYVEYVCSLDGNGKREEKQLAEHSPSEGERENEKAATCEEEGSYDFVVRCAVCKELLSSERIVGEALGHDYSGGVCTRCGEEEVGEGLIYRANADGGYYVIGCKTTAALVDIPETYQNESVIGIGEKAFSDCPAVTEIILPTSVVSITKNAFQGSNVRTIYYEGTSEHFKKIIFPDTLNDYKLMGISVYYYSDVNPRNKAYWHYDENSLPTTKYS